MKSRTSSSWQALCLAVGLLAFVTGATSEAFASPDDSKIDRALMARLTDEADAIAPFFVVFAERADLKPAYQIANRTERARWVAEALQTVADRSQAGVRGYLRGQSVAFTPFWVENKIYVPKGTLDLARALARRPEVAAILPELIYTLPPVEPSAAAGVQAIEWNISKIKADQVWPIYEGSDERRRQHRHRRPIHASRRERSISRKPWRRQLQPHWQLERSDRCLRHDAV